MPTRREFLASTALPALAAASKLTAAEERAPIIDTHLHCFAGKDDARFPYHKDGPYAPDDPATPEHLLACMAEAGVDYAIVVHPEPYQDDHRYLEHCLTVGKGKLKGTCLFFADRPETFPQMKELVKKLPIVSLRIHAYNPDRLPPFGKPELNAIWTAASDAGLAVQIHFEPRHAEGFEPLIRDFPKTRVLIDHLGRPFQGSRQEHAVVMRWAKYDNVVMKLSAVPNRNSYPHRDPQAIVKQLTAAFGADRLMYGGGFGTNTTGKSYRKERERIAGFLAHLSDAERAKIFGGVAARVLGFA
jgi:predicted TIM-barrel fold metal-dependent hydrolase